MSKKQESDTTKGSTTLGARATPRTGIQKLHEAAAVENAQGFRGTEVDPTPNENYTVKGVTSGAPTPETDVGAAKAARAATGLGLSALEAEAAIKKQSRGEK